MAIVQQKAKGAVQLTGASETQGKAKGAVQVKQEAAAPSGFQPAWAANSTVTISGGVY